MRGDVERQQSIFVVFDLEQKVPMDHPLRKIKRWADDVLAPMSRDFNKAYGTTGKPGIPPEQLIKALLLQALYSIPSETKLVEAIQWNVLYRWFLDLPMEKDAWTQEAFSMNRDRFELHDLYRKFFDRVVSEAIDSPHKLASPDHFTIDGTLIRSLASQKSLKPIAPGSGESKKQGNNNRNDDNNSGESASRDVSVNWRGERRSNATHRSTTDPDARLMRKGNGRESHLSHSGHVLMENRSGLCLAITVDRADGHAERRNALRMLKHVKKRHQLLPRTVGMDMGYKAGEFLLAVEAHGSTPHVPMPDEPIKDDSPAGEARRRAKRRMRTVGYRLSQRVRKRCEQIIGWGKTVAGLSRTRFIGHVRIENSALICAAAYNLLRMTKLMPC
ncbi:MAG: IS5 family transposase [Phycisphaerales bacterium]|nr:IS5 family transposase [Phycisphaerales bacterium]